MSIKEMEQPGQALPRLSLRPGFRSLPGRYQLVVLSLVGSVIFAIWPGLLDRAKLRSAVSLKEGLQPQRPLSAAQFAERLEDHYTFGWLHRSGAQQERRVRLALSGFQLALVVLGAIAGRLAHAPQRHPGSPYRLGLAGRQCGSVRARAALVQRE